MSELAEGARLEIVCVVYSGTEGSNPSLSAIFPFTRRFSYHLPVSADHPLFNLYSRQTEDRGLPLDGAWDTLMRPNGVRGLAPVNAFWTTTAVDPYLIDDATTGHFRLQRSSAAWFRHRPRDGY